MMKFFRKYNKHLMVIVTILCMLVFIGDAFFTRSSGDSAGVEIIGEAYGQPITRLDMDEISGQTAILNNLSFGRIYNAAWRMPWGWDMTLEPLETMDYLLLMREVRNQGGRPDVDQARALLERLGPELRRFTLEHNYATERVEQALANYLMVEEAWKMAEQSQQPSELEIRHAIKDRLENLNATILRIAAAPLSDPQYVPTDAELQSHFDKYKEQARGKDSMSMGYRIPDRIRVEYVQIQTGAIPFEPIITETMARQYWQEYQSEFVIKNEEAGTEPSTQPAPQAEPTTTPATSSAPVYYQTFVEARPAVMERLTTKMRDEGQMAAARELSQALMKKLSEPWAGVKEGSDGYLLAPESARTTDYLKNLVAELKAKQNHGQVIELHTSEWLTMEDAEKLAGLGSAVEEMQGEQGERSFTQMAFLVQGLLDISKLEDRSRISALARYEIGPLLMDEQKSLYLFRVVDVQPAHAPESLAAVRDAVVADLQLLKAHETARQHAEDMVKLLTTDGLQKAWDTYEGLDPATKARIGTVFEANPFPRAASMVSDKAGDITKAIRNRLFVDQIFDLLDSKGLKSSGVITVVDEADVFVVQLQDIQTIDSEKYTRYKQLMGGMAGRERVDLLKRDWFDHARIRNRTQFKFR